MLRVDYNNLKKKYTKQPFAIATTSVEASKLKNNKIIKKEALPKLLLGF